jgi:hypothetical protein
VEAGWGHCSRLAAAEEQRSREWLRANYRAGCATKVPAGRFEAVRLAKALETVKTGQMARKAGKGPAKDHLIAARVDYLFLQVCENL